MCNGISFLSAESEIGSSGIEIRPFRNRKLQMSAPDEQISPPIVEMFAPDITISPPDVQMSAPEEPKSHPDVKCLIPMQGPR